MRYVKISIAALWLLFGIWISGAMAGSDKTLPNVTPNATPSICVAADGGTQCVVISNIGSTNTVCVGDSSVGAAQCGMSIPAQQSGTICNSDNQWCYSASGTTIGILELRK